MLSFSSPEAFVAVYSNIATQLDAAPTSSDRFNVLTALAVQVVPGAEAAGITQGRRAGRFETLAATNAVVRAVDSIQYELLSGPGLDAVLDDRLQRSDDLCTDERWPAFGARAFAATGICSMLSLRLFLEYDAELLVGLNLYSSQPAAFDAQSQVMALILGTHGAVALAAVRAREQAANLHLALESRTEIGIAMGVLMNQHKLSRDDAFNLLRVASQHTGRKVADIATEVADTGTLPVPEGRARKASH